ncbi:hypothetical protein [Novosphingobium sp. ERN07]|uniref:hypothetical protein n=1 Tax=Novosphingobium sp. ERN07 TaxID=2726187 RepID=UPI0014570F4E|nr:hypothetical protein [Novosphingobium sp. ERN07]
MSIRLIWTTAILAACSANNSVSTVSPEAYTNLSTCWEREGRFQSFVVLHEQNSKYYPYFISPWCDVHAEGYPKGLGFVPYITALKFSGDGGALRSAALFANDLEATTPSHSPLPIVTDSVYLYVGSVERLTNDGFFFYRISDPKNFQKTGLTLLDLIEQSPVARLQMFKDRAK